jgi:quinol monooxygenase YgiN
MEKGCQRCDFCQSTEDESQFFFLTEWNTQENLMAYQKSEYFKVFRGAMNLLKGQPYEKTFHSVVHPTGVEEV